MIDLKGAAYEAIQAATVPWYWLSGSAKNAAVKTAEAGSKATKLAGDKALETMGLGSQFASSLGSSAGKWLVILVAVAVAGLFAVETVKSAARKVVA